MRAKLKKIYISGFTLVEMIIAATIMSVIAVTVSLALNQSYKRTIHIRNDIARRIKMDNTFRLIADDLQWATAVSYFSSTKIIFDRPRLGTGVNETIKYFWQSSTKTILRQHDTTPLSTIAAHVASINFAADTVTKDNIDYLKGVYITVELEGNPVLKEKHYIPVLNKPQMP